MAHDVISEPTSLDTQLFRASTKHVPMLVFTADPTGRIDFVTERWAEMTGDRSTSLLDFGFARLLHPADRSQALASWRQHITTGTPYAEEWRFRRADGTYRYLEVCAEPRRDVGGEIVGWYGAAVDIDARRRAMSALELVSESAVSFTTGDDVGALLERVSHAVLEGIADISIFDIGEGLLPARRCVVIAAETDRALADAARGLRSPLEPTHPLARSLAAGESSIDPTVDDTWRAVGIRSLVVAPLRVAGRTIGALTLLRMRPGAPFDRSDRLLVEDVGRRVAAAVDNIRLALAARAEARARDERFRLVADFMPQLMWIADENGEVVWTNRRWTEYTGQPFDVATDTESRRVAYHPDDLGHIRSEWERAVADRTPLEVEARLRRHDGAYRWFLYRAAPVAEADGVVRWYGSSTDIDDERRTSRAMRAFADIGAGVGHALGLQQTLDNVMQTIVPEFADWGFVNLLDEAGDLRVAAIYHSDPQKSRILAQQIGLLYARGNVRRGTPEALRAGRSFLLERAVYEDAAGIVEPEVLRVFWETVGFRSVFSVPLIVGNISRGTLTLCMARESERQFSQSDVPFFEELAHRIAPAIGNAEAYDREHRVAQSFQRAALPAKLPVRPGFTFDAIYATGRTDAQVGGDWYDAFVLADGRIVLSIGDVAGSGLQAAVVMSNVRQTIRGVSQVHADPKLMLASADAALREESPDRFVTAFVAVFDPVGGVIEYASAGHPPPLLRLPDGTVEPLAGACGPPLGLRDGTIPSAGREIPRDSLLVLYTDGLIESTRNIEEGERTLRAAIATIDTSAHGNARTIHDAVLQDGPRDDVAILTVAFDEPPSLLRWRFDATDVAMTNAVRHGIVTALRERCYSAADMPIAELILAELVANLTRYAPGPSECVLETHDGRTVLHVLDEGPGFAFAAKLPNDVFSESGRGLFLIASLSRDFSVTRRRPSGSHARVVLRS